MPLSQAQIMELRRFAYAADKEARSDLVRGYLRNEDDYTSNFTGALRRIINSNSKTGLTAISYMLDTSVERATGCDATIIFTRKGRSKVTIFEAKSPGLNAGKPQWDWRQTASGLSHFSDQLSRQAQLNSQIAVFEMFYCDYPFGQQPPYMHDKVSSCVWYDDAASFDSSRSSPGPWTKSDLIAMLQAGNHQINEIIRSVCACEKGDVIPTADDGNVIAEELELEGLILQIRATDNEQAESDSFEEW